MLALPESAEKIIARLNENGYEAFVVGGFVRDMLLGRDTGDTDITTNALPQEVKRIFSDCKIYDTGIRHGTVTVITDGAACEITTYRKEAAYSDNRHPDEVSFCLNLTDDLSRRDFTVNAIAYNAESGICDPFGGQADILNRLIRAIGSAEERFREDSLRILRALRFSSVLGFEIEKETQEAIHSCAHLIKNVAAERISAEFRKMLCGKNIKNVLLSFPDVFSVFIPEIAATVGFCQHNYHHRYDIYTHTAVVVENTPPKDYLRLAAFFHDCAKPDCFTLDENGVGHFYAHASLGAKKCTEILKRLKFDNKTVKMVETLVRMHDGPIEESKRAVKRKLAKLGEETLRDLIALQRADTAGLADAFHERSKHFDEVDFLLEAVLLQHECFCVRDLAVDGYDLMNEGLRAKKIGDALDLLVAAVIDGKTQNNKEALLKYLRDLNL